MEKTLVLIKPDGVQRRLVGQILARFERKGLKILAMKLTQISKELAAEHYKDLADKPFYPGLVDFVTSRPLVAMILKGPHAVSVVRGLMGATFGFKADPGTIRGDFGISNQFNLVHGSDSLESAERECSLFFKPEEILEYAVADDDWHLCD